MFDRVEVQALIDKVQVIKVKNEKLKEIDEKLVLEVVDIKELLKTGEQELDLLVRASDLVTNLSTVVTQDTLDKIALVVNKALGVIFNRNINVIIEPDTYRDTYPHFNLRLSDAWGERSFKLTGSGLKETISFLFTLCLIEQYGQRRLIILDEILNGVHPQAKTAILSIIDIMSKKENPFQFVVIEYYMPVGTMYEVVFDSEDGSSSLQLADHDYFEKKFIEEEENY